MKRTNAWAVAATVGISALALGSAIAANSNVFAEAAKPSVTTEVVVDETVIAVDTTAPTVPPTVVRYEDVYIFETAGDPGVPTSAPATPAPAPAPTIPDLAQGTVPGPQPASKLSVVEYREPIAVAPAVAEPIVLQDVAAEASAVLGARPSATAEVEQVRQAPALAPSISARKAIAKPSGHANNYQNDNNEEGEGNDD
jgi:hypothetical protein